METTWSVVVLSLILVLTPLIRGEDPEKCPGQLDETLVKNGQNIRCLNCQNMANSIDHGTAEVCECPEGSSCVEKRIIEGLDFTFQYECTTKVDNSNRNSGLFLDGDGDV